MIILYLPEVDDADLQFNYEKQLQQGRYYWWFKPVEWKGNIDLQLFRLTLRSHCDTC